MKRTVPLLLALLLTLTMPACAASEAVAAEKPAFSDVPASAWYAEAVHYVSERGLMDGTGGGKFSPDDTFTRAQLATVLYRIAGQPDVTGEDGFSDTKTGAWYADAVLWASRSGVVNGIGGGQYGTNKPTAQEQLVTMLWRMEGEPEAETVADSSAYAAKAVGWARTNGIAPMTADYTFAPKENATRAQIAAVLQGYLRGKENAAVSEISLTLNGRPVTVAWESNASVDALRELLRDGPLTVEMTPYGGFEQVGFLDTSLPRNDVQTVTSAGDIVLYSGNQMVVFYSSNSWAYTRLGRITDKSRAELQDMLGAGHVTAVLSSADTNDP